MRFTVFFLISGILHGILFFSVSFRQELDEGPEVFVRKGKTVIRMTIVPPKPDTAEKKPETEVTELIQESEAAVQNIQEKKKEQADEPVPAQAGTAEDGAVSEAAMIGRSLPPYPLISRRRGEEGTVLINVTVSIKGMCLKAELLKSSGYGRLDRSALQWARESVYTPGKRGGNPVRSELRLKVPFILQNTENR